MHHFLKVNYSWSKKVYKNLRITNMLAFVEVCYITYTIIIGMSLITLQPNYQNLDKVAFGCFPFVCHRRGIEYFIY
jgi:hypothetical protein